MSNGKPFMVSFRSWGRIMAEAYPEECGDDPMAYVVWAFSLPMKEVDGELVVDEDKCVFPEE